MNKQQVAENIWLNYYNTYLCEQGIITESQRNAIKLAIEKAHPSSTAKKSL